MKTGHKYFFSNSGNKAACLLCHEAVAIFKEYNLNRHHQTKHGKFGNEMFKEDLRKKAADCVMKLKKQQIIFMKQLIL